EGLESLRANPVVDGIVTQLTHPTLHGYHYIDTGFAGFLLMLGTAIPLSHDGREPPALRKILKRAAILFALGMFCVGGFNKPLSPLIFVGVLQRIGICYLVVAVADRYMTWRAQVVACALLIVAYGLATHFVPYPGALPDPYAQEMNLGLYIDKHWLSVRLRPEGTWSTIG